MSVNVTFHNVKSICVGKVHDVEREGKPSFSACTFTVTYLDGCVETVSFLGDEEPIKVMQEF